MPKQLQPQKRQEIGANYFEVQSNAIAALKFLLQGTLLVCSVFLSQILLLNTQTYFTRIGLQLAFEIASLAWNGCFLLCSVAFTATRMRALGNILHECSHGIFCKSAKLSKFIGNICAVLEFTSLKRYRKIHLTHHANLGDFSKDKDLAWRTFVLAEPKFGNILRAFFSHHYFLVATPWVFRGFSGNSEDTSYNYSICTLTILILAVVSFLSPTIAVCIFLPYFSFYQLLRIYSDMQDHGGITQHADKSCRARNHPFESAILNFLVFPSNDGYHKVHHDYPQMPTKFYAKFDALQKPQKE